MAPEYMRHGHISVKIDVFSFGVLVLEIISGQRNNSLRNGGNAQDLLSFVSTRGLYLLLTEHILIGKILSHLSRHYLRSV